MIDAYLKEIIRNYLVATARQMSARLIRCAYSYTVREMEDCSAGIFTNQGKLIAESANVPIHLGCLTPCLETILEAYYPLQDLEPGDVIATNDPYAAGKSMACHHTGDVIMYAPVFFKNDLVGLTSMMVHHVDVGAMWMYTRGWGVDIWQEGTRIPPAKLYRNGKLDDGLMRMILNNTRFPQSLENDFKAQAAACRIGAEDLGTLIDKYGLNALYETYEYILDYSEKRTRQELEKIPDGEYEATKFILDDGAKGGPYKLVVKITVRGSDLVFDFTGTDQEIDGPINAPLSATYSAVGYVVRTLTDPEIPSSDGCNAPIQIIAPEGTLVNCRFPAACYQRMVVCHSLVDLIYSALAPVMPEKIMAESTGCNYNNCSAINPETSKRIFWGEVVGGGLGARASKDGLSAMACHVTNCPAVSVEVSEVNKPVLFLRRELWQDSGGPGEYRGGLGQILAYKTLGEKPQFHHTSQKAKTPPQGVYEAKPGKSGKWVINSGEDNEYTLPFSIGDLEFLNKGDTATFFSTGGGGYGNPLLREPERVREDVVNGLVSMESAEKDYGVVIDPETYEIEKLLR